MNGWGLIVATVVVLSNLAAIAVDFFYLLLAQVTRRAAIADLADNVWVNTLTCLVFITLATWIAYRDMQTTQKLQYWLVGFQLTVFLRLRCGGHLPLLRRDRRQSDALEA